MLKKDLGERNFDEFKFVGYSYGLLQIMVHLDFLSN